jgi:hypothetical protein
VAVITQIVAIRNQRALAQNQQALAELQSDLAEKKAERDARRDYEYEARKRLYEEYEPQLFQLVELAENALYRVHSLARSARLGHLRPVPPGWLSTDDYYMLSTLYLLFAPLAAVNLINRRLTLVDLTVDPYVNMQYILAKYLNWPFTSDFDLAKAAPTLLYDPFVVDWQRKRTREPATYWRQGMALGTQEKLVEALFISSPNEPLRVMSFGQFEDLYRDAKSEVYQRFNPVSDLFLDFHPKTRPVLWRILITQAHLWQTFIHIRERKLAASMGPLYPWDAIPADARHPYDWRQTAADATDEEVLVQPFAAAEQFLRDKLEKPLSPRGPRA